MALLTPSKSVDRRDSDINILLLGETGVGKSTFINSFANYVQFRTLKEALESELVCLIPTCFTIPDDNYVERLVKIGGDTNEDQTIGNSSTQGTKSYVFPMEDDSRRIRLIDTPGIGDARGLDHDNINFENILDYLSNFDHLHAICFLLKPNVSILTAYFKFCILHLLSRLDKSAVHNIIFVFTNSRSTLYKPGETLAVLRRILQEIEDTPPHLRIPLGKANVFCLDNEAFRFLVALQNGISFETGESETFAHSWKVSADTCARLLDHISGDESAMKPHYVKNTLSVNEARRLITDLTKPLVDISDLIEDNLMLLNRHTKEIARDNITIEEFKKNLFVPAIDLVQKELDQPVTVCTAAKCSEKITVLGITKYHYKQVCHSPCYLTNVPREVVGSMELVNCWAMNDQLCRVCGCHCSTHMHILYETETVGVNIVDDTIQVKITTTEERILEQKNLIQKLKNESEEYALEKHAITKSMAKFVHFLKEHSISLYNDAYEQYLDYLITRETNLGGGCDKTFVKRHEELQKQYLEEKRLLESVLMSSTGERTVVSVNASDIDQCVRALYDLKHTGQKIRELHQMQEKMRSKEHAWSDEYHHVKPIRKEQNETAGIVDTNSTMPKTLPYNIPDVPTDSPKASNTPTTNPPSTIFKQSRDAQNDSVKPPRNHSDVPAEPSKQFLDTNSITPPHSHADIPAESCNQFPDTNSIIHPHNQAHVRAEPFKQFPDTNSIIPPHNHADLPAEPSKQFPDTKSFIPPHNHADLPAEPSKQFLDTNSIIPPHNHADVPAQPSKQFPDTNSIIPPQNHADVPADVPAESSDKLSDNSLPLDSPFSKADHSGASANKPANSPPLDVDPVLPAVPKNHPQLRHKPKPHADAAKRRTVGGRDSLSERMSRLKQMFDVNYKP